MTVNTGVKTRHPEYNKAIPHWERIRDVLNGNVKKYLRDIGASEPDKKYGQKRQEEYEDSGIFINFTQRTLDGMVGSVMRKPAEIVIPDSMQYLLDDADGVGVGLEQQAQACLADNDSIGRYGLLVDSASDVAFTMAERNAGKLDPRILAYTAENIINWKRDKSMIVVREDYEYQDGTNEFDTFIGELYRVLELVDGRYQQRIYKFDNKGSQMGDFDVVEPTINGQRLDYVPFFFVGAKNNDPLVDNPPFETLADINIGHYRNSADTEESAFIAGQPTLMIYPGERMTPQQFKESNPDGIRLGARAGHNLGAGGSSELLQADPNTASRQGMMDKEEQAVRVGAQLITPSVQVTAESARLQKGADTSVMATVANNVSDAYEKALQVISDAVAGGQEVKFELNTEFFMQPMTAQDRTAWMADINAGLLPKRSYWASLRAAGVTKWTDEEIEEALEGEGTTTAPDLDMDVDGEIPPAPEGE